MRTFLRFVLPAIGSLAVAGITAWAADNAVKIDPGSTVTMKSMDIGAGVQMMQNLLCSPTTPSQCAVVNASGQTNALVNKLDGADVTLGAKADAAWASGDGTLISVAKAIATNVASPIPTQAVTVPIGGVSNDACQYAAKTNAPIFTSATAAQLVAPSGSTQVYVCSVSLITTTAATVNFTGGTGATCLTGTPVAIVGSLVAANGGLGLSANGGLTVGSGSGTIMRTTTAGHGVCITQSGSAVMAGNITYVQQ